MLAGRRFFWKLGNFLKPGRAESELAREITSHLTLLEDDFRRRGMEIEEARLAARRAYGGIEQTKELHREERSFLWLEQAWQDIRFSSRTLTKNPGFTITSVFTLALGIGANTAIFNVIDNTLLKPLPYRNPDQLVRMIENVPAAESFTGRAFRLPAMSQEAVTELRNDSKAISMIALYFPSSMVLTRPASAQVVQVTKVSPQLLPMLGVQPLLGRTFRAGEDKPAADRTVLLSYGAWVRYFDAASNVLGRSVVLDDIRYSVIGVMPRNFQFPDSKTLFWKPLVPITASTGQLAVFPVLARINAKFPLSAVSAEVNKIFGQTRGAMQPDRKDPGLQRIEIQTLQDAQSVISRPALTVLAVAVGFVLLIAYANVSNLLLARTASRQREIAIRASLGAGGGRLIRQCLTEGVFLGAMGGLAGIPLTLAVTRGLLLHWSGNIGPAENLPRLDQLSFGIPTLLFTFALSILAGISLGVPSALRIYRTDYMESIKRGTALSFSGLRLRRGNHGLGTLVIAETGLAFVLLIAAGLLIRSFLKLSSVDPGFDTKGVLTFQVASPPNTSRNVFNAKLAERLRALPGVQAAGYGELLPLELDSMLIRPLKVDGTSKVNSTLAIQPRTLEGSWNYFQAIGMRLLSGRWFKAQDGPGRRQVMLVNQAFSRYYFGDQNPVGRTVSSLGSAPWEIVGVVADVRQQGLRSRPEPQFFLEYRQMQHANPGWNTGLDRLYSTHMYFALRTTGQPSDLVPSIRQMISQLDKTAVINNTLSLGDVVSNTIVAPEFYAVLVGTFSSVAIGLAAIGLYGVIAYAVNQRTREIGIRLALGASRAQTLLLVLGQGVRLASFGFLFGVTGSAIVTRYLESMLFGVTPLDFRTFATVSGMFAMIAIAASYIPANRATKVDPVISLRYE